MRKGIVIVNRVAPSFVQQHFKKVNIERNLDYQVVDGSKLDPNLFKGKADIVCSVWATKQQVIDALKVNPNIQWVHSFFAGVDGILSPELEQSKAILTNAKGAYSVPLGEWAVFCMLWQSKHIGNWLRLKRNHQWEQSGVHMAKDATLGIVAYGDIGLESAKHVKGAFGSRVIALDINPKAVSDQARKYADEIIGYDKFDYLLKESDVVLNISPLTPSTKHMWNKSTFAKMKPTAVFANIGRGPSVNEIDLIAAIKNKTIAGAVLDVFETEPLPKESPLWDMDEVFITPHFAGLTADYFERSLEIFDRNLKKFLEGKQLENVVNKKAGF